MKLDVQRLELLQILKHVDSIAPIHRVVQVGITTPYVVVGIPLGSDRIGHSNEENGSLMKYHHRLGWLGWVDFRKNGEI
jgi:hypothetical protein